MSNPWVECFLRGEMTVSPDEHLAGGMSYTSHLQVSLPMISDFFYD
jgi:hypothetical protein